MKTIVVLIICTLIGFYLYNIGKPREAKYENRKNTTKIVQTSARASSSPVTRNTSEHTNIDKTLRIVAEKFETTDANGDGKNNCIDAAILFYQYYPDKSKVCIELNHNSKTGMNHLFNCVFTDGVWKAIEPQAYDSNHSNYFMWAVWGKRYDNSYNRDVTTNYLKYVKK